MARYDELISVLRSLLTEQFAPKPRYIRAVLGDGRGNVVVPGNPDRSYARFTRDSTTYFEIFNRNVNPVNNWPVLVGELPWQPGLTQVVDTDWSVFEQSGWGDELGNTSPHAPTHVRRDGSIGSDPLDVYLPMIAPARAYTTVAAPSTVYVNALEYGTTGTFWGGLPGIDLQPLMDATVTGTMRFAGVYIDTATNTLGIVTGSTTVHTSAFDPPRVSFPAANAIPVARVKLYGGQAVLSEVNDFRDARRLFGISGAGAGTGWPFAGILTVDPTDPDADFSTIQDAIDSVAAGGAATIWPGPALYVEDVTITDKNITLALTGDARYVASGSGIAIEGTIAVVSTGVLADMFVTLQGIGSGPNGLDMTIDSNGNNLIVTAKYCSFDPPGTTPVTVDVLEGNLIAYGVRFNSGSSYPLAVRTGALARLNHSLVSGDILNDGGTVQIENSEGLAEITTPGASDTMERLAGLPVEYLSSASWNHNDGVFWNVTGSFWQVRSVPGATGVAPSNAQYVTLAANGTLTDERVLTAGDNITLTDAGAGNAVTVAAPGVVGENLLYHSMIHDLWQEGTSFDDPADDSYFADLWVILHNASTPNRPDIAQNFDDGYAAGIFPATSSQFGIVQFLEAKDTYPLRGQTLSLSFEAYTGSSTMAVRAAVLSFTGTADGLTSDVVGTWASGNPTLATGWAYANTPAADITVTTTPTRYTVENITVPGGANNLALFIWAAAATTISLAIKAVKLEVGATATDFVARLFEEEQALCQRFYWRTTATAGTRYATGYGMNLSTTSGRILVPTPAVMRTNPTVTGAENLYSNGAAVAITSISNVVRAGAGVYLIANVAAGLTANHVSVLNHIVTGAGLQMDARL